MRTFLQTSRAQITIYLLVGMVLLIVFGSIFYFVNLLKTEQFGDVQKDAALDQSLTQSQLQRTLTECLRQASEEVVFAMGLQSGHVYQGEQYGPDDKGNGILYNHIGDDYLVPFGIMRGTSETPAPEYPQPYGEGGYRYTIDRLQFDLNERHIWGKRTLPKLCEYKGENGPRTNTCDVGTYGPTNTTIQYKVMVATEEQTKICLVREGKNLDTLVGDLDINKTTVSLLLTDSTMKFTLTLNATSTLNGRQTELEKVTHVLPVRLLRVYNLLFYLIEADITDVHFDKSEDYGNITRCNYAQSIQCWDGDMKVSIIRNPQPVAHPGGDIILIEDRGSIVKGQPFFFATSVENRPPAIDYLTSAVTENAVDFEVDINETLLLRPFVYDPDEDELEVLYKGWKQRGFETSTEYLTGESCQGDTLRCGSFDFTQLRPDVEKMQITVVDEGGLSDYQPLQIRIGNKSDDDGKFCPDIPTLFDWTVCPLQETCDCLAGEYCFADTDTSLSCQPGSICCQEIEDERGWAAVMTCDGAECYQSTGLVDATQNCVGNATCHQESIFSNIEQTCTGSNCWQETRGGVANQTCRGKYCLQETNTGELITDCDGSLMALSELADDQNATLRVCS